MHRGVLSVPFDTPLTKVAQMMARYRMHCVVALEERGEYQTRYWGLIPAAEVVRIATKHELEDRTAGGSIDLARRHRRADRLRLRRRPADERTRSTT